MSWYKIMYGVPEVNDFIADLETRFGNNQLRKPERQLLKKLVRGLTKLATNPRDRTLESHEIVELSRKYAPLRIWESYLENKKPGAYRLFWYYHPTIDHLIVIVGIQPHPDTGDYTHLKLSMKF